MNRTSKIANLRVCASCEWIFSYTKNKECPKCGFASYGAKAVYGNKAYKYAKTQEPWINRKLDAYRIELLKEHVWAEENKQENTIDLIFSEIGGRNKKVKKR